MAMIRTVFSKPTPMLSSDDRGTRVTSNFALDPTAREAFSRIRESRTSVRGPRVSAALARQGDHGRGRTLGDHPGEDLGL